MPFNDSTHFSDSPIQPAATAHFNFNNISLADMKGVSKMASDTGSHHLPKVAGLEEAGRCGSDDWRCQKKAMQLTDLVKDVKDIMDGKIIKKAT